MIERDLQADAIFPRIDQLKATLDLVKSSLPQRYVETGDSTEEIALKHKQCDALQAEIKRLRNLYVRRVCEGIPHAEPAS